MLLIDEIDRADDDFEAFLLELLAEAAVTIPEIGTMRATHPPAIVLTSNRTRDLHDAVKRRCLYQWIDYPSPEREVEIIRRRVPAAAQTLAVQVADAVSRMRDSDVQKPPGIAEAIDWLAALEVLGLQELDEAAIERTLGSVLKYREDQDVVRAAGLRELVRGRRRDRRLRRGDDRARPAAAGRRVQPPAARGRRAGDGRAGRAARPGADADRARRPPPAVLHRPRRGAHRPRRSARRSTACSRRCSASVRTCIHADELPEDSRRVVAPHQRWGDAAPAPLASTPA